ncbi:UNVERIFIED_CONTAM: SAC3 family protein A, partial [Sesamum calycinum]
MKTVSCSLQFDSCIASLAIVQSSRTELFKFTAKVPVAVSGSAPEGYWKHGASALQNDLPNSVEQLAQKPPDVTAAHESFQNQQTSTFSQGSTALYPASYQVSQIPQSSFQTGLQASEPLDSRRANKLQIPTNPRIASNLPSSISKPDKDSSMTSTGAKPAYVSVIMQKPNEKVPSYEEDDSMLKKDWRRLDWMNLLKQPGMFPKSLRGYVERALARCKNDRQKTACQAVLKEFSGGKIENKDHFGTKFSLSDHRSSSKNFARPAKRQRLGEDLNAGDDGEISSDSDKEQNLTKYYSAAIALADSPEEKRRENRSKRFDKGHGNQVEKNNFRGKDMGAGKLYARRASAGTCQEIEKRYLRLTSAPDPATCQSQLKTLYGEGITGCHMEFAAYNLLCVMLHSNNNRDLLSAMSRLSANAKMDKAVKHALSVRSAVTSGNYVTFFRLYKTAPNLNTFLMDLYVEKMRYAAVKCMSRSYRPTVPVSYLSQILGFTNALPTSESIDEKEVDGVEECIEWLKAHGACLISDSTGETLLDAK